MASNSSPHTSSTLFSSLLSLQRPLPLGLSSLLHEMAALLAEIPLPILAESLLASSWTWLVLSVATIATLVRALSGNPFYSRPRPEALLLTSRSHLLSAEKVIASDLGGRASVQNGREQLVPSWCTNSTEALGHTNEHVPCSPVSGPLACLGPSRSAENSFSREAFPSEIRNGLLREGSRQIERVIDSGRAVCSALCLGCIVDTQEKEKESCAKCEEPDVVAEDRYSVRSAGKPAHQLASERSSSVSCMPPSFESQFGWGELVKMRLGFPWQPEAGKFSFASAVRGESIVRQWSEHERNLHAVLKIAGNSVRAMSADILGGLACFSHTNGDLSQWDIMNQACRSRVFSEGYPVSVIHNEESSFAIAGAMDSLRLWDFRSPGLVSIMKSSVKMPRCQALHCEGNVVSASQSDGFCRSCDTRKMQVGWLSEVSTSSLEKCLQENELEQVFSLWEKLSLFDEDESWDEPPIQSFLDESHHNSSSFALRCATIVRSLSSGNR